MLSRPQFFRNMQLGEEGRGNEATPKISRNAYAYVDYFPGRLFFVFRKSLGYTCILATFPIIMRCVTRDGSFLGMLGPSTRAMGRFSGCFLVGFYAPVGWCDVGRVTSEIVTGMGVTHFVGNIATHILHRVEKFYNRLEMRPS